MLLDYLSLEEKQLFKERKLSKGEILFLEGSACEYVGVVISGQIDIVSYLLNGEEIQYNSLLPGGMFGNNLIFASDNLYRGNVIAVEDSVVSLINKANLMQILGKNQLFLENYLKIQSDFGKVLNARIKLLSFSSAEERILYYLQLNKGKVRVKSITVFANTLSLKRETVSRYISKLIKEKKIYRKGKDIYLLKD